MILIGLVIPLALLIIGVWKRKPHYNYEDLYTPLVAREQ